MTTYILIGVAALLVTVTVIIFNTMVAKKQMVDNGWADIDVQLKKRADLIPNLVDVVKGYAAHEKSTLDEVISQRNQALSAGNDPEKRGAEESRVSQGVSRLIALAEAYPDLKASDQFLKLQEELSKTENDISYARRFFNGAVREYNVAIQSFPSVMLAPLFGFRQSKFFEIDLADRAVPEVNLGGGAS